jgi:hypothetical protein
MNRLLKQTLLVCAGLTALTGQVIADSQKDEAYRALTVGNYAKAAKLFRPLAEHGDADAQGYLGFIYKEGNGVPQDYKKAVRWYRLAAEQGDADAQMRLGLMYADGLGVPQDYVLAHMWTNISAANEKNVKNGVFVRNDLAKQMTNAQIAMAQELARKCIANNLKGC